MIEPSRHQLRDERHRDRAVRRGPGRETGRARTTRPRSAAARAEGGAARRCRASTSARCPETSSSCTPRPSPRRATCRRDRDRRRRASSKVSDRSWSRCRPPRARAAGRGCAAAASDSSRREEPGFVHQVGRVACPSLRHRAAQEHADPAGAVDGGDAADRRCACIGVVVLHVMADRAVMHDVVQLDDAGVGRAQPARAARRRGMPASIGVTT